MDLPLKTLPSENKGNNLYTVNAKQSRKKEVPIIYDSIDLSGLPVLGDKDTHVLRRMFWFSFIVGGLLYTAYYIGKQVSLFIKPINIF